MESAKPKVKKKGKGKKEKKHVPDDDDSKQQSNTTADVEVEEPVNPDVQPNNDSLIEEHNVSLDTTIDITEEPERPTLEKRSSSLKEIVVDTPRAQSPEVAINIPDSPREDKSEPTYSTDLVDQASDQKPIEKSEKEIEDMENGINTDQGSGQTASENSSLTDASIIEIPESYHRDETSFMPSLITEEPSSASTDRPSSAERPSSSSKNRSSLAERPSFASKDEPISAERPSSASKNRPSSAERPFSASKNRPSSAERPSSASKNRPSSAERPFSASENRPSSAERPASASKNRPSSAERPASASKERPISAERPSSADRLPFASNQSIEPIEEEQLGFSKESMQLVKISENPELENIGEDSSQNITEPLEMANDAISTEQEENIQPGMDQDNKMGHRNNFEPAGNEFMSVDDDEKTFEEVITEQQQNDMAEDDISSRIKTPPPPAGEEDELPWAMYKKMKNRNEEELEKNPPDDELNEEDESADEDYVPPTNEELPDLYEVMDSLDKDDIELNMKTSPPSIMDSDQQLMYQKQVQDLKQGIAEDEIKIYLDEFEKQVEQEILMIGNISLEDVQDEERRLREEHISFQQEQARVQRRRQQEILQAMERAKKYVMNKYKDKYRELRMREEHLLQKDRTYKDEIHRAFRRSESQLRKALKRRKAEVKTMYGDLIFADGQYGGSKGRRWKIDWNRAPQPVQIRLKCLRGVKDKLPSSRYVLMVSLYNRLGGNVMKWSNLKGQQWGGATLPIYHDGEFFNIEMKIDQSVFTVCPSRPDIRPGMVLIFELFILRGPVTPTDKVVGWGCFPICDAEFNVIEGRYKTPILRGDMDPGIDKFEVIEKLMATDLENWLCNFYFEIIKLPRYMAGQKEYEVELQFTSGLLSSPDRTKNNEDNIDGEKAIFGSSSDLNSPGLSRASVRSPSIVSSQMVDENGNIEKPPLLTVEHGGEGSSSGSSRRKSSLSRGSPHVQMFRADHLATELRKRKGSSATLTEADKEHIVRPMTSVAASRKLVEERGLQLSDDEGESSGTDYSDDNTLSVKKELGFRPVKGQPGMFYKIHYNTPSDVYARKVYTMMPKTPVLTRKKGKRKLTHLEQLDTHSFPVKAAWSNKGRIEQKGRKKVQYMGRMILSELGISQIKSREFWAMLLMILITYWMRMYCHYIGQWVALLGFLIPLNKFEFLPYTVNLNYQNTLLRTREEIALIVIGPFTNILLFVMMVIISAFVQFLFERFPNIFSRFIMTFGIHCVFDPIWILITDSAIGRYENRGGDFPIGDAFKLYWHFDRYYNNDNVTLFVSIALTVFLYFVTMFCACAILYMYFLRLHNNGRLMDVYWRLHGKEGDFFLPYDLEVSNEELNYICRKAEQWRGEEGERRKTAVYDYIWEEEEVIDNEWDNTSPGTAHVRKTGAKETTTHVSIHTLHLDGLRELYRHFLKLPDGAVVEVFGEMNVPGIDEGVKQALIKRTTFQSTAGDRSKSDRASRASSCSTLRKDDLERKNTEFLNIPGKSS